MQSELRPCAYCGSSDLAVVELLSRGLRIECEGCGAYSPVIKDGPALMAAWNTRASDAEITRLTEALRAAEDREKALVRLVERAQVNTPDQYVNWHEHARQALAGAKP